MQAEGSVTVSVPVATATATTTATTIAAMTTCGVCGKNSRAALRCGRCEGAICEDCGRGGSGALLCSDCEFFGRLQDDVRRKEERRGWLKAPGFWASLAAPTGGATTIGAGGGGGGKPIVSVKTHGSSVASVVSSPQSKVHVKRVVSPGKGTGKPRSGSGGGGTKRNLPSSATKGSMPKSTKSQIKGFFGRGSTAISTTLSIGGTALPTPGVRYSPSKKSPIRHAAPGGSSELLVEKERELKEIRQENRTLHSKLRQVEALLKASNEKNAALESAQEALTKRITELEGLMKTSEAAVSITIPSEGEEVAPKPEIPTEIVKVDAIAQQKQDEIAAEPKVEELAQQKSDEIPINQKKEETIEVQKEEVAEAKKEEIAVAQKEERVEAQKEETEVVQKEETAETQKEESVEAKKEEVVEAKENEPVVSEIPVPPPLPGSTTVQPDSAIIPVPPPLPGATTSIPVSTIPIPPPLPGTKHKRVTSAQSQKSTESSQSSTFLPPATPIITAEKGSMLPPPTNRRVEPKAKPSKFTRKESVRELVRLKRKSSSLESEPSTPKTEGSAELRPVFWNVIPGNRVEGTLWDEIGHQEDEIKEDDIHHFLVLEEKFAKPKTAALPSSANGPSIARSASSASHTSQSSTSSQGGDTPKAAPEVSAPVPAAPARPKILDGARQQNIQIALGRTILKDPNVLIGIRDAIIRLDRTKLTPEVVTQLLNYIPTPEETKLVEDLTAENISNPNYWDGMTPAEEFVVKMSSVPRLRQRLQCLFVESSFELQSKSLDDAITEYESACTVLKESNNWKQLLKLVLTCGNYVNDTNASRAGAWGFELTTGLPKLGECKAGAKYSLLHWIAQAAETKCPGVFSLPKEFEKLDFVGKIKVEDLKAELVNLSKGASLLKREIELCDASMISSNPVEGCEIFSKELTPFCNAIVQPTVEKLTKRLASLETTTRAIVSFHGEKENVVTSQKLFEVISTFCKALVRAHDDLIAEKKAAEEREAKLKAMESSVEFLAKGLEKEITKNRQSIMSALGVGHGLSLGELQSQKAKLKSPERVAQSSKVNE